jgi:hypothetical protein
MGCGAAQCKTFRTKAAAEVWAREIEARIDDGQTSAQADSKLLLSAALQAYRELRDKSRPIADTSNEHYMIRKLSAGLRQARLRAHAAGPGRLLHDA